MGELLNRMKRFLDNLLALVLDALNYHSWMGRAHVADCFTPSARNRTMERKCQHHGLGGGSARTQSLPAFTRWNKIVLVARPRLRRCTSDREGARPRAPSLLHPAPSRTMERKCQHHGVRQRIAGTQSLPRFLVGLKFGLVVVLVLVIDASNYP